MDAIFFLVNARLTLNLNKRDLQLQSVNIVYLYFYKQSEYFDIFNEKVSFLLLLCVPSNETFYFSS